MIHEIYSKVQQKVIWFGPTELGDDDAIHLAKQLYAQYGSASFYPRPSDSTHSTFDLGQKGIPSPLNNKIN